MHIRSFFQMSEQQSFELLKKHSFGQMITCSNGQITQSYLPFIIDKENNCLYGHIAKQNKQIETLQSADDCVITFLANDAYISPNWYQSNEQVPTWNYQAVEIKGWATLLDDKGTLKVIDQLSQIHEAQFKTPWMINKLSEKKINAMLKAIIGFRIDISEINGQSKMSQNKGIEDRQGVIDGLFSQQDIGSHLVAEVMKNNNDT